MIQEIKTCNVNVTVACVNSSLNHPAKLGSFHGLESRCNEKGWQKLAFCVINTFDNLYRNVVKLVWRSFAPYYANIALFTNCEMLDRVNGAEAIAMLVC